MMKYLHRKASLLALLMTLTTGYSWAQAAETLESDSNVLTEAAEKHHLVIQLVSDDLMSWKGLMKNLSNLTSGWPELEIMVVCHGPGIYFLHNGKSPHLEAIKGYIESGVTFAACENTMKGKKIDDASILASAVRVPMGIQTIVLKQDAGWAYVKAGL